MKKKWFPRFLSLCKDKLLSLSLQREENLLITLLEHILTCYSDNHSQEISLDHSTSDFWIENMCTLRRLLSQVREGPTFVAPSPPWMLEGTLETFRSEDKDDYEYEFPVLSMRTSKNVGLQTLSTCSVRKTRTRSRPRPLLSRVQRL